MITPNDYALVIGVQDYPNYTPLQGPVNDAEEFAKWLKDKETGGGLPNGNCRLLLNPSAPIGAEIDDELDLILTYVDREKGKGKNPNRFYFYFSGHGQANEVDEVNLCLRTWSATRRSRVALSANQLWNTVIKCNGFHEVVVFLDCCRVRSVGAAGVPPGFNCARPLPDSGQTRTFIAFSSEYLNPSYEAVVGDDDSVQGYFTKALLAALWGGAAEMSGGVNPLKLQDYLEQEVTRLASKDGKRQQARVEKNNLNENSLFGCAPPSRAGNLSIHFSENIRGPVILVSPNNSELTCPDIHQEWVLVSERGPHYLIDKGQNPPLEKGFRLSLQEETTNVNF